MPLTSLLCTPAVLFTGYLMPGILDDMSIHLNMITFNFMINFKNPSFIPIICTVKCMQEKE